MKRTLLSALSLSIALTTACAPQPAVEPSQPEQVQTIPEPVSWAFPGVIESARTIAPNNIEGRPFNRFGLAYPLATYDLIDTAHLPASELQKYADVVTHAYPDAVFLRSAIDCNAIPLDKLNSGGVASMAYIAIHGLLPPVRHLSLRCFTTLRQRLQQRLQERLNSQAGTG